MAILETTDLKYIYPDGTLAIEGVSVSIEKGKKIAFVGPNGSGKSTLFLLLNGTLEPRKGKSSFTVNRFSTTHPHLWKSGKA